MAKYRIKEVQEGMFSWFYPQIKLLGIWWSISLVGHTSLYDAIEATKPKKKVKPIIHKL